MFFIRLPQLAVLAKILCLLMVVMCGAVPSQVRSVSLYSTCSRGNVTVYGRAIKSTVRNEDNAPYQKMTTQSEDFSMKLYIYAEESKRYICFNKRWKVVSLPKKNKYCQFHEIYNGRYLNYQSAVNKTRFIGFNKNGKAMASPQGRKECYNFIKLSSVPNVAVHNQLMNKNTQKSAAHRPNNLRNQQQNKAFTIAGPRFKNSLYSSESSLMPRLTKPHHRHRHSNSLKMMREDPTRRRHKSHRSGSAGNSGSSSSSRSSLLVEAAANNKY